MEGAGYTGIIFFERLNCYVCGKCCKKFQNIWFYGLLYFIYGLCASILTLPFCGIFLPDYVIAIYWIGSTTFSASGLLIICWKNYKKLQLERHLKNNLNRRYILTEEHANITVYVTIVMMHCIASYFSFSMYIFQKNLYIKRGYVRVIIDLFVPTFSLTYFLAINLIKPSMRKRFKSYLVKLHIIKVSNQITPIQTKAERDHFEREEHYRQLRKLW
uniref:Serpentine receptor class gamma n=1 Tax=Strongyloides papillosus TaxID=174720 RepID=A0A0N5BGE6_STREA